jgi:hypothetical protein
LRLALRLALLKCSNARSTIGLLGSAALFFRTSFVVTLVEAFIAEFKRRQVVLRRQIALMENGMMRTEEKRGGQWINTTPQSIEGAEQNLAEIERLLIQAEKRTAKPGHKTSLARGR